MGQALLARHWHGLGVFDQYSYIFDTDPNYWLPQFAHGRSVGWFNHPLLTYLFSLPIIVTARVLTFLGMVGDEVAARETMALMVAPLAAAVRSVALFATFRMLHLALVPALLATGYASLAMSAVLFGATPGSYAVSGAALALILVATLALANRPGPGALALRILVGFFAIGTTISNVIHLGWMTAMARIGHGGRPLASLLYAGLMGGLILAACLTINWSLSEARGIDRSSQTVSDWGNWVRSFTPPADAQAANLMAFPALLARTVIPTEPLIRITGPGQPGGLAPHPVLTYDGAGALVTTLGLGLLGLILAVGGTLVARGQGGDWHWMGTGAACSLVSVGVLYSLFGDNPFLYSVYWQVPLSFLMGAFFTLPILETPRGLALATLGLAALAGLLARQLLFINAGFFAI